MGETLDIAVALRGLCRIAGLAPESVREVQIHPDYVVYELVDGSVRAYLREDS